ncbi:copper chaperone PCu(A)C [Brevibacterium senegalense]|uniref:copper chaperone PCu(A)C n=1 Tax=Brevibacterium senegalense TaxID=1033736 RepID=UPI00031C1242|nr:copper chaperone PCu(A)C [Brevibacterium senegalense]
MRTRTSFVLPALTAAVLVTVAACGQDSAAGSGTDSSTGSTSTEAAQTTASLTIDDPWVKAAEDGMTSSFGLLTNEGDEDVTLTAVESSISDSIELHETADDGSGAMSMNEVDGGFPIAAGETLELAPGGDHIMFMEFDGPLVAGDTVDLTLVLSDGSRIEYDAAVRDFAGANESYSADEEGHGDHDHGDDDHGDMDHSGSGDHGDADDDGDSSDDHSDHGSHTDLGGDS